MYSVRVLVVRGVSTTMIAASSSCALLTSYRSLRKRPARLHYDLEENEEKEQLAQWKQDLPPPLQLEEECKERQQQRWPEAPLNEQKEKPTRFTIKDDESNKESLSLDRIRAEMQAMYEEMYKKGNVQVRTPEKSMNSEINDEYKGNDMQGNVNAIKIDVQNDNVSNAQSVDNEVLSELESRFKRSAKYYNGEDVHAQVAAQRTRLRRMLINDAEDALRCKDKRNVLKYLHYSGVYSSFDDKSELYALVNKVRELVSKTKEELHIETEDDADKINEKSHEISEYYGASNKDISRLSWIKTLHSLSHHEIRLLWENGLLDAEILQELLVDDTNDDDVNDDDDANRALEFLVTQNKSSLYLLSPQQLTHVFDDNNELNAKVPSATEATKTEFNTSTNLLIDDEFDKFEQIRHMSELAREIKNYTLHPTISAPSLELATVLEKAHEGQMRDITLEELENLEQYEKGKIQLNVPIKSSSSSSDKEHCSLNDLNKNKSTYGNHEPFNNTHANNSKKLTTTEMNLDKSLAPANYFVHAVAQHDKVLWESLRALEQIRCEVLLDSDFQQAVQLSQSMDANCFFTPEQFGQIVRHRHSKAKLTQNESIESKIKSKENDDRSSDDDDDNDDTVQGKREFNKLSKRELLLKQHKENSSPRAMLTRPHNAADVPYFFGSIRSVIPPKAKYNLPTPALSAHEKRVLFSKMRQQSKKRKFTS